MHSDIGLMAAMTITPAFATNVSFPPVPVLKIPA